MNGATTEPSANIIKPPKISITIIIGINQNFFRRLINLINSFKNSIFYISRVEYIYTTY